ncbi:MAG: M1 family metallopeptidase, partial [Gemmatimonadales bacterium]
MLVALLLLQTAAPTPAYWQQQADYWIEASLDESRGVLSGTERLEYRNNSPSSLDKLYFHLYLNAFRPGSRWADADSAEGVRRFNDLRDPDFGFNHVGNVRVDGRPVPLSYPYAPDSTIVELTLSSPIPPGGVARVELDFDARPSTLPRRQGRRGRAYDFAQWYPRVAVFDKRGWQDHPLYPAGEFYGEFGSFTVRLDVPDDQVVGATGVPVCGDPGWERANRQPDRPVEYERDRYPGFSRTISADLCAAAGPGRKTILWRAEDVHHFAISMRPDYRYEGGRHGEVAVHVLYQPGDEQSWGNGTAVRRTETALAWLRDLFGPFPWPQITNVHRIEGGGTEFPMMIMDGSPGLGLILHELGHNYLMGILANNEWREGFLDEGFTSFQTSWFFETNPPAADAEAAAERREAIYRGTERGILGWDLDERSEPTSLVSERYRDFPTYSTMIYSRGELFFQQLRAIVGDETMRRILRTYYDRWKLKHVDEEAFRQVAEEVSGRDLRTFFAQWLHGSVLYDYAVGKVRMRRAPDRGADVWAVRVEVKRKADGIFPVELMVRSDRDTVRVTTDGIAEVAWVDLEIRGKPKEVMVDPDARAHDWNMLNNRRRRWFLGWNGAGGQPADWHVDRYFSTRTHRDRQAVGLLPT